MPFPRKGDTGNYWKIGKQEEKNPTLRQRRKASSKDVFIHDLIVQKRWEISFKIEIIRKSIIFSSSIKKSTCFVLIVLET